jgi:cytochrome c biogenesis protein CcmG/thiol:disulfide interchange protein DsbE
MSNRAPWVVGAVVVAVLAVIAVVVAGGDGDGDAPAGKVSQPVTVTGAALPPLPDGGADPAVGSMAPILRGSSFDGTEVRIEPGDGTRKIVLFVAHWCPHCQREVPVLVDHLAANPLPDDLELVTVSTGVDANAPNYPPQEWLADERWSAPVLADSTDNAAAVAYGLTSYPYFVALRGDGSVVARVTGELTAEQFAALVAAARR